jgi:Phage integrase, N-terminal SAM-like domain
MSFFSRSPVTLTWYEKAAGDLSPSTSREYRRLIDKRLLPAFGRIRVRDLTPPPMADTRALLGGGGRT